LISYHPSVRYLRMLLNSVLAGCIAAAYLTVLFLQLNPSIPMRLSSVGPLALVLLLSYGLHFGVVFYVAIVLRQMFVQDPLSPGWLSVRVLAWLGTAAASCGSIVMWLNLRGFRSSLQPEAAQNMALGAAVLTAASVGFVVVALVRRSVQPRWRLGAVLLAVLLVISVAGPLALRGAAQPLERRTFHGESREAFAIPPADVRVTMLLVDGASLDFISPAAAAGRLPNFGRILDSGSVMHLATLRPTQPEPVWTAVATGKRPSKNGVRSASTYHVAPGGPSLDLLPDYCLAHGLVYFGFLDETPHSSSSVQARTVWDLLTASGISSVIVRWPLTFPARPLNGVLVSDQWHRAPGGTAAAGTVSATYPRDLVSTLQPRIDAPAVQTQQSIGGDGAPVDTLAGPHALDRMYAEVFDALRGSEPHQFLAVRYQGLDNVGHTFLRQAMPRSFGDVSEEERRKYGRMLETSYRYVDDEIGKAIADMGRDDLLLVVSAFGMEPVSLPKRALERLLGDPRLTGTHERAPDGFLMAYGRSVRPGRLSRASVVDVTPTVLYFFGLPIGRDMDGYARTDIFSRAFTEERPLTFIPTYER
jgi:predicted AlkP superfamily phosphohydrolase/phosphomutase